MDSPSVGSPSPVDVVGLGTNALDLLGVIDGHPATLAWLGAVAGHRVRPLGVEHFGQTGSLADLYRHYGIDANAIVAAAQAIAPGRPIRHLKALP